MISELLLPFRGFIGHVQGPNLADDWLFSALVEGQPALFPTKWVSRNILDWCIGSPKRLNSSRSAIIGCTWILPSPIWRYAGISWTSWNNGARMAVRIGSGVRIRPIRAR